MAKMEALRREGRLKVERKKTLIAAPRGQARQGISRANTEHNTYSM